MEGSEYLVLYIEYEAQPLCESCVVVCGAGRRGAGAIVFVKEICEPRPGHSGPTDHSFKLNLSHLKRVK